ncbi:unnamed protein product, partial [Strongylus vulgaris]
MQAAALCFLIGAATAVIRQPLTWQTSPRIEMIRRGVYEDYLRMMDAMRAATPGKFPNRALDYHDYEYVSTITIGTPQQRFVVVPDTGSADLWVPDVKCDYACRGKHKFSANSSSTFVSSKSRWSIRYATGDAKGVVGKDIVRLGGEDEKQLVIPDSVFGLAEHISPNFKKSAMDGVLGLAFSSISEIKGGPPLLNAVKRGLLEQPIFTVWLAKRGLRDGVYGGQFTYGGLDTEHCGPVIAYEPLTSASHWRFK